MQQKERSSRVSHYFEQPPEVAELYESLIKLNPAAPPEFSAEGTQIVRVTAPTRSRDAVLADL